MAYFSGSADTSPQLLARLAAHAGSLGWQTDRLDEAQWYFHNRDGFWSLSVHSATQDWYLAGNTGYDAGKGWSEQPGSSVGNLATNRRKDGVRFSIGPGPFHRYHLFATEHYLHLHLQRGQESFRACLIGMLDKQGIAYTGGQYVCSTYIHNDNENNKLDNTDNVFPFDSVGGGNQTHGHYARIRIDALPERPSPDWLGFGKNSGFSSPQPYNTPRACGLGRGYLSDSEHPASLLVETSANNLTDGTVLVPCTIFVTDRGGRSRYIGRVRDFAVCHMDYLAPGATVTHRDEIWRVFPPVKKNLDPNVSSGLVGYAYKVVQ